MCEIVNDAIKENGCLTMQEAGSFAQKILGKDTVCLFKHVVVVDWTGSTIVFQKKFLS